MLNAWFLASALKIADAYMHCHINSINSILLGIIYHPPRNDDRHLRSHIFKCLDQLLTSYPNSGILVLGDFNQFHPGNLCCSFKLRKLVTEPTRGNNILDQAYTNLTSYYNSVILPPIGSSDHRSILLQPSCSENPSAPTIRIQQRECKASNKRVLISTLDHINWTPIYRLNSCEEQLDVFQSTISNAINFCLPMRSVKTYTRDKPWITQDIKGCIKKRQLAWVRNDTKQYKIYRNKTAKLCKIARKRFYQNKIRHTQDINPKKWWDNIKMLSGLSKQQPPMSMLVNGSVLKDKQLAEAISDSFYRVSSDIPTLHFQPIPVTCIPDLYIISPEAVEARLSCINERKATGPDEIPNWLLKSCAVNLRQPVCSIFNASIRNGEVPKLWKSADVLPLGKITQPKSIESDLRPISLTTVLSKILESFVFSWLAPIVMPHIDPYQFGSVKRSSTTHALVHLVHYWLSALEAPNTMIRTCLIDFAKAFDRIDHNILMHKLLILGVPPVLLNWCSSFLQERQQRVKVGTHKSSWKQIAAGVPQGTKLGPLFFLIMVNDLRCNAPLYKYVDDCAVTEIIKSFDLQSSSLQREIDYINQWSVKNNMKLNVTKTKEFNISLSSVPHSFPALSIDNQHLDVVHTVKLLGVYLSADLKWTTHINHICSKASKRLFAIRILKRNGVKVWDLRNVYCSFIRPVLEYACPVWHFSLPVFLCDQIEQIQRRALKIIYPDLSYKDGLNELNLPTLVDRRVSLCKRFYENNFGTSSKTSDLLPRKKSYSYNLRNARNIPLFKTRTSRFYDSFLPTCVRKWDLP